MRLLSYDHPKRPVVYDFTLPHAPCLLFLLREREEHKRLSLWARIIKRLRGLMVYVEAE